MKSEIINFNRERREEGIFENAFPQYIQRCVYSHGEERLFGGGAGLGQGEVLRALRINRGGAPRSHDLRATPPCAPDAISTSCYVREREG